MNKSKKIIYLDYASSVYPNPSGIHALGVKEKIKLETARKTTAEFLYARPKEIIFTSGGTESNNLAILGLFQKGAHLITTNIEHSSVLESVKEWERRGGSVTIVPVEKKGIVDSKKIKKALKKNTVLVSVMHVNNEIGTIQPIREIAKEIRYFKKVNKINNLYFHTDAVQAVNYLDLNVERLGVDLMTLSGSKIYNAGKVGVLYKRNNVILKPILFGGDQEGGYRAGTENVIEIVKFTKAFSNTRKIKDKENIRLEKLQKYFIAKLLKISTKISINADIENRISNNVNITVQGIDSDLLVIELSARGIMASSKSACKTGDKKGSYVLQAINPNFKKEDGSLRFSFGMDTKKEDLDYTLSRLKEILKKLEKWYT